MSNPNALPCAQGLVCASASVPACRARKWWVLAAAILGSTVAFIDESVVNVALPQLERSLRATFPAMEWVINAYTLCLTALMLAGGSAADQFGRRRVYLLGVTVFALASVGCGLAANVPMLIVARAIQGVGAALLIPCTLALIGASFEGKERGTAIGIWSGATAMASGAAPLLGGFLVDHWSWRTIFLVNPIIAVPALWITIAKVPESRDPGAPSTIDWPGTLLAFGGLGCLAYGLIESAELGWHPAEVASVLAGALLLVGLLRVESKTRWPLLPLELFRSSTFSGANLFTLLLYGALGAAFFFLPFLLIQADGYSATSVGLAYLPFTLILGFLSRWSGGLIDRYGARKPLIGGPLLAGLGLMLLCLGARPYWTALAAMTVLGFGMAMTAAPLTTLVLNSVPGYRTGVASGINNAVAYLGSLLLIAVLGGIAVNTFNHSLDRGLQEVQAPPAVVQAVQGARTTLAVPTTSSDLSDKDRKLVHTLVVNALSPTIRLIMWIATFLTLASAITAAVSLGDADVPIDSRRSDHQPG